MAERRGTRRTPEPDPDPARERSSPGRTGFLEVAFNLPLPQTFVYAPPAEGPADLVGCRVVAPFGRRWLAGCVVGRPERPPEGVGEIRAVERVIDRRPLFDARGLEMARWLARMYLCSLGEALAVMLPGGRREIEPEELPEAWTHQRDVTLTGPQAQAVRAIGEAGKGQFYLYGVTGSGKTEVFLRVAEQTLRRGRGVIYLVPEISLTHQIQEIFTAVFGAQVTVLHSGLTPAQRLREWLRVLDGQARLVIGARSGIFAPVRDLGLIVIDEEHESSYKSGFTPRYHARQVAMYRSGAENAILLMGSATPSVEAWHRMKSGKLRSFVLPERLGGGSLPQVAIQDLKGEAGPLSRALVAEIRRTKSEGRQTILFLNRRGFAYFFHCHSCGYEMKCRRCSVSLTYHKSRERMICHYCGFQTPPVSLCPQCGSVDVGYSGFGTERIEEEIERLFPDLVVRRIDTDTVRRRRVLRQVLSDFRAGKIDILLGTQMVAKGLNFPGVKLVGIVSADTGLQLPDFRAAERTFNLIVQVSGRAGRSIPDGRVVIQTWRPDNEVIRLAAEGRIEEFYAREIEIRRILRFPPFSRLVRLVFRGPEKLPVLRAAQSFARALPPQVADCAEVLGPAECPLAVIAGNHRYHLILRAADFSALHALLAEAVRAYALPRSVHLEVDVDAVSLL